MINEDMINIENISKTSFCNVKNKFHTFVVLLCAFKEYICRNKNVNLKDTNIYDDNDTDHIYPCNFSAVSKCQRYCQYI